MLVGVDEAGRGPVLGPLVIAACGVPAEDYDLLIEAGVKDSKDLSAKRRDELEAWFFSQAETKGWVASVVTCSPERIDLAMLDDGLNWLEVRGFSEAISELSCRENVQILADACDVNPQRFTDRICERIDGWPWKNSAMKSEHKADLHHPIVGMASILAKQERDRQIEQLKEDTNLDLGSGYPGDPKTKAALAHLIVQSGIHHEVRWGWATVRRFWETNRTGDLPVRGQLRTKQQSLFKNDDARI